MERVGGIVRLEVMGWLKLVAAIWPFAGLTVIVAILVVFYRQVRQILAQFNCGDLIRFRLGPLEIEKQSSRKPVRSHRRKKK